MLASRPHDAAPHPPHHGDTTMTTTQTDDTQKLIERIEDFRFTMMTTMTSDGPQCTADDSAQNGARRHALVLLPERLRADARHRSRSAGRPLVRERRISRLRVDHRTGSSRRRPSQGQGAVESALKAWFTDGVEDPNLRLIEVTIESAGYWDAPDNRFVRLRRHPRGRATGKEYTPGEIGSRQGPLTIDKERRAPRDAPLETPAGSSVLLDLQQPTAGEDLVGHVDRAAPGDDHATRLRQLAGCQLANAAVLDLQQHGRREVRRSRSPPRRRASRPWRSRRRTGCVPGPHARSMIDVKPRFQSLHARGCRRRTSHRSRSG